ncbi:MAG TPA: FG-GAP-like repeat-containing protein, partial [Acidobacteriaceae bacterium]|nr:FG-GAP-like repeat-containing protein [Acidobacteriaceae bacterium]
MNNLGVAYMNQQNMDKANQLFAEAYKQDPHLTTARINEGIALLNAQKISEAKLAFEEVIKADPANVRAWYNLGLASRSSQDAQQTIRDFQRVLQLEPGNADAHYFLGSSLLQQSEYAKAADEFKEALRLNPLHASAEFGLARAEQHLGNKVAARQDLSRFQRITEQKLASPLTPTYGEMGRYSRAQSVPTAEPEVGPMIPVTFAAEPLSAPGNRVGQHSGGQVGSGGACLIDSDGKGQQSLLTLRDGKHALHLYRTTPKGGFQQLSPEVTGLDAAGQAIACTVGDFDNDGLPDVAVSMSDRVLLFKNLGQGKFSDVTKGAGIVPANHPAGLTFVDYDHDGDLDLFVTGRASGGSGPNVLWRNNGNGTFTNWTQQAGLSGKGETRNATLSDLNNDRAVDLVVTGSDPAPTFYANLREGPFAASPLFLGKNLPPTNGVYIFDFNKDGWMDVAVTHEGAPGVTLWRNVQGKYFERVPLPIADATWGRGLTALDIDNDGWIDLAVLIETAHGPALRILRNQGPRGFADVTKAVGLAKLKLVNPRAILASDVEGNGDADLIVTQSDGPAVLLRNHGANRDHWLHLSLKGLADNKSAIGTKV